jgi:hypothetical protein
MSNISSVSSSNNPLLVNTGGQLTSSTSSATNKAAGPVDSDGDHDNSIPGEKEAGNGSLDVKA